MGHLHRQRGRLHDPRIHHRAVLAGGISSNLQLLIGTGLCGALTTYSTLSYETLRLAEEGARFFAAANAVASIVAGLGAAFTGAALAQSIWA